MRKIKRRKELPDRELFIKLYYSKSRKEIKDILKISDDMIKRCIDEFNLPLRCPYYSIPNKNKKTIDRDILFNYYIIDNHTNKQTQEPFKIGSSALTRLLREYGIDKNFILKGYKYNIDIEEIYKYYIEENHTYNETLKKFEIGHSVFYNLLKNNPILIKPKELMIKNVDKKVIEKYGKKGFPISHAEQRCVDKLIEYFGYENVEQQHKEDRYPFRCDIYILPLDLFIECNFGWTHGKHPYNNNVYDDLVEKWSSKESSYYKSALRTYTVSDPLKLSYFIKNKLNYKIFYSETEFTEWFNYYIINK